MKLEKIQVYNFKSYYGAQTIGPFTSFTAVIGPNGSGKSNLMDAISFVLGIKSNQLRSHQLRDLLYKGEKENAPAESAYVRAIFTKDGNEWVFQRTIGNGIQGSEYSINGNTVSWLKYNEALEQENILVKARNFLVFQGDVEQIASQSPKDLTKMIETISGSLELKQEYEKLKELQERATENSAFNFNKKKSVNAEMKQFKEQKEEAERFDELISKKNSLLIVHALWDLFHIEAKIQSSRDQLTQEFGDKSEFESKKKLIENKLKESKKIQARNSKNVIKMESALKKFELQKEESRPHILKLVESIKHENRKLETAKSNLKDADKAFSNQENVIAKYSNQLQKTKQEELEFTTQIQDTPMASPSDLKEYHLLKRKVQEQTIVQKQEMTSIQTRHSVNLETQHRLQEKIKSCYTKKEYLSSEMKIQGEKKQRVLKDISISQSELELEKSKMDAARDEKKRLIQLEAELNEKMIEANQSLLQARVDKKSSERESRFRETLVSLKRIFTGVYGRVIDLCKPSQKKYEAAISVILGKNLDAIVVDTESTAIECIRYMREQRAGHATFIPLDTIKVKPLNEKYRTFVKGATLAMDVIECDPSIEQALLFATGNALVCDTLEIAKYVCFEKKQQVKSVTLDGTVIHKTGMMTGGQSSSSHQTKRWEENEIQALGKIRENLHAELTNVTRALYKVSHADDAFEHSALESRLQTLALDLNEVEGRLESLDKQQQHLDSLLKESMSDMSKVESILLAEQEELNGLDEEIMQVENTIFKGFCQRLGLGSVREYEEHAIKRNQEAHERQLQFTTSIAKLENLISFEKQTLKDIKERSTSIQSTITKDENQLSSLEEELQDIQTQQESLEESIQQHESLLKNAELQEKESVQVCQIVKKELETLVKEYENYLKSYSALESEIEKAQSEKMSIYRKCQLAEIGLPLLNGGTILDISLEDINNSFNEKSIHNEKSNEMDIEEEEEEKVIELDFKKLKKEYKTNESSELDLKFKQEIQQISTEIETLAPNLRALDKFGGIQDKLKETSQDFENSRKEAKNAKDQFMSVKNERYKRFYRAYSHISEQIDKIYKELTISKNFPLGGTAYLSLEDSDEPYLDGIKYHAMPPAKRFREMELLSGGEKTVAALALLFAIHSYQPAPFFVLDEVDAALDNTNVTKVANYIKKHASQDFQFIVISLKNTFYENAEALVGVYKDHGQETTSSRVLTMDLSKYEQ